MKKIWLCAALLLLACLLVSCGGDADESEDALTENASVAMTATVVRVMDDGKLEVDVIEGDYGVDGIYWVIVSEKTKINGEDGAPVALSELKEGDLVEILYGGQVMMSYPPQIVAGSITLCE